MSENIEMWCRECKEWRTIDVGGAGEEGDEDFYPIEEECCAGCGGELSFTKPDFDDEDEDEEG